MNPAIRLIATLIAGLILTTLAAVLGMLILGLVPGHEHAAAPLHNTSTVVIARGGNHGHK